MPFGIGAEIAATVAREGFWDLDAPIVRSWCCTDPPPLCAEPRAGAGCPIAKTSPRRSGSSPPSEDGRVLARARRERIQPEHDERPRADDVRRLGEHDRSAGWHRDFRCDDDVPPKSPRPRPRRGRELVRAASSAARAPVSLPVTATLRHGRGTRPTTRPSRRSATCLFDTIDPKRYVLLGVQRYATVEQPHLKGFGWYFEGMAELYHALKRHRIPSHRASSTSRPRVTTHRPPQAPRCLSSSRVPEDAGLRYEFFPAIPFPLDPRIAPGWTVPPVAADDPLGIERCSHHTVLTGRPGTGPATRRRRAGRRRSSTRVATSSAAPPARTCTWPAPSSNTPYRTPAPAAHADWAEDDPNDTYHAITWKVADLERAERHLEAQGVRIQMRSDDTVVTDPDDESRYPLGFHEQAAFQEIRACMTEDRNAGGGRRHGCNRAGTADLRRVRT